MPANFFAHKVGGHTLLPLGEYMETLLAGVGVSQKKLEQSRDEVKRVVRALLRALDFMHAQPVDVKALIQKRLAVSDTDIVDHIYGLVTKYATRNGIPFSNNAVLTEYYDLVKQKNGAEYLILTSSLEDPTYMSQPMWTSVHFKKQADATGFIPVSCDGK